MQRLFNPSIEHGEQRSLMPSPDLATTLALAAAFLFGLALVITQLGLAHLPPRLGAQVSLITSTAMFWLLSPSARRRSAHGRGRDPHGRERVAAAVDGHCACTMAPSGDSETRRPPISRSCHIEGTVLNCPARNDSRNAWHQICGA